MTIQPHMIYVEYDFTGPLDANKNLRTSSVYIAVDDKVKYDRSRQFFYTYNHYRKYIENQLKFLQIGFKWNGDYSNNTKLFIKLDNNEVIPLTFCERSEIWFEPAAFKKHKHSYKFDSKQIITGHAQVGNATIIAKQNDTILSETTVVFLPSSIPVKDYNMMLSDLYRIHESLLEKKSAVKVGKKTIDKSLTIESMIQKLDGPIRMLSAKPQKRLDFKWLKDQRNKTSKFRLRSELEKIMQPGKQNIRQLQPDVSINLHEHKMLKSELLRIRSYCKFYDVHSQVRNIDENEMRNEVKEKLLQSNGYVQGLFQRYAVTPDNLHNSYLQTMKNEVQSEIQNLDADMMQQMNDDIKQLQQFKQIEEPKTNGEVVDLTLRCELRNVQLTQHVNFSGQQMTSDYRSTYFRNAYYYYMSSLVPISYSYVWKNKDYCVEKIESLFVHLSVKSNQLKYHWKLSNAFDKAAENYNKHNKSVVIQLKGQVRITDDPSPGDDKDIIGIQKDGKNFRDYHYTFLNIDKVIVEEEEIVLPKDANKISKDLARKMYLNTYHLEQKEISNRKALFYKKEELTAADNLLNHFITLYEKMEETHQAAKKYTELGQKMDAWLQLPLFQNVYCTGLEQLQPTQLFLQDPIYLSIWNVLQRVEKETQLSHLPQVNTHQYGVKKVDEIYETWTLYKMLYILTKMGWELEEGTTIQNHFKYFLSLSKRKNLNNFKAVLLNKEWKIEVLYEPRISVNGTAKNKKTSHLTPDFVFRFYKDDVMEGIAYADTKYRNYMEQGKSEWEKDILETAIEKYGDIRPSDRDWQQKVLSSFIIHSDVDFEKEKPIKTSSYNALYDPSILGDRKQSETDSHKYGSFPMIPSWTHSFKTWFRMNMEYRLGDYENCWACGSDDVEVKIGSTEKGNAKFHYKCRACPEFWVKSHCKQGHTLIKHSNNYHAQTAIKNKWYTICPVCGDGLNNSVQ